MHITGLGLRLTTAATLAGGLILSGVSSTGASTPSAGNLIYVSPSGAVELVSVSATGVTSSPRQIGPVSVPTSGETVIVSGLVASGDGVWAAWSEAVQKSITQPDVSDQLVLRDNNTGEMFTDQTDDFPIGFTGDQLVVSSGVQAYRVDVGLPVHLVSLHDKAQVIAAAAKGVVDDALTFPTSKKLQAKVSAYEHIRLRSFGGKKRPLHTYTDLATGQKIRHVELSTVSGDSRHLVIERGDKTDFGGIGPSSVIDEYNLTGTVHRRRLGHYGTGAAQWRAWAETFVGSGDQVWVSWYSAHTSTVKGVVARYVGGKWQLVASHAVFAAGNRAGYAVVQPGRFAVVAGTAANQHLPMPTANAILFHNGHEHAIGIEGSAFVWVSKNVLVV